MHNDEIPEISTEGVILLTVIATVIVGAAIALVHNVCTWNKDKVEEEVKS